MNAPSIFGTDGIRDIANSGYLTAEFLVKLGKIIGLDIIAHSKRKKVIIGRDTRPSGEMIESALSAGLLANGADIAQAGYISTPGLAYLTKRNGFHLGIMISASHNPAEYNGIKLFGANGLKLSVEVEEKIEKHLRGNMLTNTQSSYIGSILPIYRQDLVEEYINETLGKVTHSKIRNWARNVKIVLDCANGSLSEIAPLLFKKIGADVISINCATKSQKINYKCGSLHPEMLKRMVIKTKADIGFSFDGDGDRVIMADEQGIIRDGDAMLYVTAQFFKKHRLLKNNAVVGTIMSNSALEVLLAKKHIRLIRTLVGDKYVLAQMLKDNYSVGGEPSGHLIFLDYSKNGDGLITALVMLRIMKLEKKSFGQLAGDFNQYPQLIVNIPVTSKPPLKEIKPIQERVTQIKRILGNEGRLILRYSGTEKLARIMIEGQNSSQIKSLADSLARIIENILGNQ
jgi:phosphoglucosamine mutase